MTTRMKLSILTLAIIMIALMLMACSVGDVYVVESEDDGGQQQNTTTDTQEQDEPAQEQDEPTQEQVNKAIGAAQEHGAECLMNGNCKDKED
jgi:hypothetical protein